MSDRPLSEGFGQLKSLVTLSLQNCKQLRALPEGISSLSFIWASGHQIFHFAEPSLSEGFGQLESLKELKLDWCKQLRALPAGILLRCHPFSA